MVTEIRTIVNEIVTRSYSASLVSRESGGVQRIQAALHLHDYEVA
jgi:hypothetical protein